LYHLLYQLQVNRVPTPNAYTRERRRLSADDIDSARAMVAGSRVPGRGAEWADTEQRGLVLRVLPMGAVWYLRLRTTTVRLGTVDDIPTAAAARVAAMRVKVAVADGRGFKADLNMFSQALELTGNNETRADDVAFAIPEPVDDAHRRRHGPWTWDDLVAEHLAAVTPGHKASWATQYRTHLSYKAFKRIGHLPLSMLTVERLEEVREDLLDEVAISSVARAVSQTRAALDWAWRYHRKKSALGDVAWWLGYDIQYKSKTRKHEPTLGEIGRTLALAERHRVLGTTSQETTPGTLKALWGLALTGQRTGALGGTRRSRISEMPERPGWQVWNWRAAEMKGTVEKALPHALPVPPEALAILAQFDEDTDTDTDWVFPSRRVGRHVTSEGIAGLLDRMQGKSKPPRKTKAGKPALKATPRVDLFAKHDIRPWVPHDVRRALASYLDEEELGGAGSAILAHKTKTRDEEAARLEDVTRKTYAKAQRLKLKAAGMETWVGAVIAAYQREAAAMDAGRGRN
jgi:integrase